MVALDDFVVSRFHLLHLRGDLIGDYADDDGEDEEADEDDELRDEPAALARWCVPLVRRRVRARDVVQ